jgi:hypothetical protein
VVFHRRRSSHLFYTRYVFSQCQTRVKLNHFNTVDWSNMHHHAGSHRDTDLHPGISSRASFVRSHRDFMLWALHLRAGFHLGLARPLSRRSVFDDGTDSPTDTFPRVTTAPRRSSPRDYHRRPYWSFLRLPRTRLSRPRPPTTVWPLD